MLGRRQCGSEGRAGPPAAPSAGVDRFGRFGPALIDGRCLGECHAASRRAMISRSRCLMSVNSGLVTTSLCARGRGMGTCTSATIRPGGPSTHENASGQVDGLVDVVGDEQHGSPDVVPDGLEQPGLHLGSSDRVEGAEGFVKQQEVATSSTVRMRRRVGACLPTAPTDRPERTPPVRTSAAAPWLAARPPSVVAEHVSTQRDVVDQLAPGEQGVTLEHVAGVTRPAVDDRTSNVTRPAVGSRRPAETLNNVDFPEPLRPTSDTNSPISTENDTPSMATPTVPPQSSNDACTSLSAKTVTSRLHLDTFGFAPELLPRQKRS